MKIAYILFFGLINLLIFSKLTKKIKLDKNWTFGLIFLLGIFGIIHALNPFDNTIPNKLFLILLGFSFALIGYYYMSRITLAVNNSFRKGEMNDLLNKGFNFITLYLIYGLIYIFQIATLIKN